MKNKKKKFSSLKSILILLTQLQVKYYSGGVFDITTYSSGTITVYISTGTDGIKSFEFNSYGNMNGWESIYIELLDFINTNPL